VTDPPPDWQVKVTPRDRGDLALVEERLRAAGLRSVRRRRSSLLGARNEEEALQVAERVRQLPLPPVEVRPGRVSRIWMTLYAWFQGGNEGWGG
jgi:hypothetical protein